MNAQSWKEFCVPVFVYVYTAEDANEAREIVLSALDGIDSWNELVDSDLFVLDEDDAPVMPIGAVCIGNPDEVTARDVDLPSYVTSHAGRLDGN